MLLAYTIVGILVNVGGGAECVIVEGFLRVARGSPLFFFA